MQSDKNKTKIDYKWIIVGLSFLMVLSSLGFCSSTKSLYLSAITEALDIKRSLFSISDSCRYVTTAIVNIFFGKLISKYGSKKMILAGFVSLIIFAIIFACASNVYAFYLGGIFLGMGLSWTTTTMVGYVVNAWCKEHKGTIMGFVLAANGVGAAIATQILSPLINDSSNKFGYRNAYILTAVVLAVVAVIILIFYREKRTGIVENIRSSEDVKDKQHISIGPIRSMPYFYVAAACVFVTGMMLQGVNGIAVAHMKDVGLDTTYIAAVFSFHSIALAASKFLCGFIHDRIGIRKTILICDLAAVIASILLISITPTTTGNIIAVFYCITFAIAQPLETIMLPLIVMNLFGKDSYEKLLGIFVSVNTAGYALGNPLTNLCYDNLGNYNLVIIILAALMVCITVAFQIVFRSRSSGAKENV